MRPFGHAACSHFYLSVEVLQSQRRLRDIGSTLPANRSTSWKRKQPKKTRNLVGLFFISFHLSAIGSQHVYVFWMMIIARDTNCTLAIKAEASCLLQTNAGPSSSFVLLVAERRHAAALP